MANGELFLSFVRFGLLRGWTAFGGSGGGGRGGGAGRLGRVIVLSGGGGGVGADDLVTLFVRFGMSSTIPVEFL